jgi:hypothetical protein
MSRHLCFIALLGLAVSTGCTICQSPYDYCGPAYREGAGPGDFNYRRGSVLTPGSELAPAAQLEDVQPKIEPVPEEKAD